MAEAPVQPLTGPVSLLAPPPEVAVQEAQIGDWAARLPGREFLD
jgi:hypothetical protein